MVQFAPLTANTLHDYLQSGEWEGKAGGYAIQGRAASFIKRIDGSYSNVVGLCLYQTSRLLSGQGFMTQSNHS
jgi:septum formation protein